jgi:hypothetical protein
MSDIFNKDNVREDVDVHEIEKQFINNKDKTIQPTARFDNDINDIISKLGLSMEEDDTPEPKNEEFHIDIDDYEEPEVIHNPQSQFAQRTQEEQKRQHINNVIGSGDAHDFSFEKEREEDEKYAMLADIDFLMESLESDGANISRIPRVDENNDLHSIDKVLKILRHKVDHSRYITFAEEFILFGAQGVEYAFDGKNMWFGQWNPNLTGWHTQVNRKLRRMRTDTGKIVSGVMGHGSMGPLMRVCLELIPSMFLYSQKMGENSGLTTHNLDRGMDNSATNGVRGV